MGEREGRIHFKFENWLDKAGLEECGHWNDDVLHLDSMMASLLTLRVMGKVWPSKEGYNNDSIKRSQASSLNMLIEATSHNICLLQR